MDKRLSLFFAVIVSLSFFSASIFAGEDMTKYFARFTEDLAEMGELATISSRKAHYNCSICQELYNTILEEWMAFSNVNSKLLVASGKGEEAIIRFYTDFSRDTRVFVNKYGAVVRNAPANSLCGICVKHVLNDKELLQDAMYFLEPLGITDKVEAVKIAAKLAEKYDRTMLAVELYQHNQSSQKGLAFEQYANALSVVGVLPGKAVPEAIKFYVAETSTEGYAATVIEPEKKRNPGITEQLDTWPDDPSKHVLDPSEWKKLK